MREGGGIPVDCAQSNFSSFFLNSIPLFLKILNSGKILKCSISDFMPVLQSL